MSDPSKGTNASQESPSSQTPATHNPANELDRGLNIIGLGRYNLKYYLLLAMLLISSHMEMLGYSIVLPTAKCDLHISDKQRGVVSSIPYIGVILTSYVHGYLTDTRGRKKMLVYTTLSAGCTSFLAAFMPNLLTFSICKFLTALCIAVPAAIPYTLMGEILPGKQRDLMLSITNGLQLAGTAFVPLIAWLIIPMNIRVNFGVFIFRPWRLLTMIYALFLLITGGLLSLFPESPKFLLSRGKPEDALKVLQIMYASNKRKEPKDFPITSLPTIPPHEHGSIWQSLKRHTVPLLQWEFLKYILLNGFLMFGIYSILNGVYIWVLEVLNRVLTGHSVGKTACQVIMENKKFPEDAEGETCDDTIDSVAFIINSTAQISCAIIGFVVSFGVKYIGKRALLILVFYFIAICCLLINHITSTAIFAVLISAFPLMVLGIGPINAYCVEIFPTHLRGMSICLVMTVGRFGSIGGSTFTGILINIACSALFYGFAILQLVCGSLSFLHK